MKKLLVLILSVIAAFAAAISLTACGKVDFTVKFSVDGETYASVSTGGSEVIKMPADPQKDGYTFDGWFWDDGVWARPFTANSLLNEPLKSDMTVYAKFSENNVEVEVRSKSLTVTGNEIKGKVANAQTTFSFINDIEVADGANYAVYSDLACVQPVPSKTISLIDGDNVCYILVTNGNDINLYTVTVRRRPIYTVAFDTSGGTSIDSQQVEEDSLAAKPADPEKQYYIFTDFEFDFSEPIVNDITINTLWEPVKFNIYYNLNGGKNNTDNPTTYTIEDKIELKPASDKLGYSFASWDNGGVIEKGSIGDKTFTANYTPITYKITYNCGSGENNANNVTTYNIESDTIKLLDAYYINADFVEWQRGGVKVTEIPTGTYGDITLTAVWSEYDVKLALNSDGKAYTVTGLNTDKTDIEIKVLTKNITSIRQNAFYNCSSLTSINIPDGVTSIGDQAFHGCTSLTSITIPDGVSSIGYGAFYNCTSLKYNEYESAYYLGNEANKYVVLIKAKSRDIKSCRINKNCKVVYDSAFGGCSKLTSATIPDSVMSIGQNAFSGCTSLTSLIIPDSVTSIGSRAFYECTSLTYNEYDNACYLGNDNNPYFVLIKAKSKGITDCNISEKCKFIYDYAFYDCTSLTSLIIPDSVTSIGYGAFEGCSKLTSITIPNSVTSIGYGAFSDCTSLKTINYKGTEEQWFAIRFIWGVDIKKCTINYNYS